MKKENHEYADIFPMMAAEEIKSLADDIKKNGLLDPVVLHDGKILDGRNRHAACELAGVDPRFVDYGGSDPLGYVLSHNLQRRHLTASQRAMIAETVATMRVGDFVRNQHTDRGLSMDKPQDPSRKTRQQAAAELGVSEPSIDRARVVRKKGIPELGKAVESGHVTVSRASDIAKLPQEEQPTALEEAINPKPKPIMPVETLPPQKKRLPPAVVDSAKSIWHHAKAQLDKIIPQDVSRETVLNEIIEYAKDRLANNK